MSKKQKLSIYVKCNQRTRPLTWCANPVPDNIRTVGQQQILDFYIDYGKISRIAVVMEHDAEPGDGLEIKQITLNDIVLQNWRNWSTYVNEHGQSQTFGHMIHRGKYLFTIRQNALVHNYVASWWNHDPG